MNKTLILALAFTVGVTAGVFAGSPTVVQEAIPETAIVEATTTPKLSHRQEVWIGALEWCESRGNNEAVNEVDLDGTASYYAFQFKPGTLRYYGELYGIIEKGKTDGEIMSLLKEYDIQRSIVEDMVLDHGVQWERQFPGCVAKLGRPPLL